MAPSPSPPTTDASRAAADLVARIRRAARGPKPRMATADAARLAAFRAELASSPETVRNIDYQIGADGKAVRIERVKTGTEIVRKAALPAAWALVLYRLVRELRPRRAVELGTGAGFSAAHIVAALRANGEGELVTVEGAPDRASVAERQLSLFGAGGWRIEVALVEEFLPRLADLEGGADFAFIDADHLHAPVVRQVAALAGVLPDGGIIVLDDLPWPEVERAWREVTARPDCAWAAELVRWGQRRLGVWVKGPPAPGYRGTPERLSLAGPLALVPVRGLARGLRRRAGRLRRFVPGRRGR